MKFTIGLRTAVKSSEVASKKKIKPRLGRGVSGGMDSLLHYFNIPSSRLLLARLFHHSIFRFWICPLFQYSNIPRTVVWYMEVIGALKPETGIKR
jgi:hypothetical protein